MANDFLLDDELKCPNYKGKTEKSPLMSIKYFIFIMNQSYTFDGYLTLYDPILSYFIYKLSQFLFYCFIHIYTALVFEFKKKKKPKNYVE